jgi:hypothetical protein
MRIGALFFLMTFHLSLFSQDSQSEIIKELCTGLREAIKIIDPAHYKSQMQFKGIGEDTFEIRNFLISYKSNDRNPLYGYDFQIAEVLQSGDTLSYLVVDQYLYIIHSRFKKISEYPLPEEINFGSYLEYIRYNFILKEIFQTFLNATAAKMTLIDSLNQYHLISDNGLSTQGLILNRGSFLPVKYISTITDPDFGFRQTIEILFNFDAPLHQLSSAAFSIEPFCPRVTT